MELGASKDSNDLSAPAPIRGGRPRVWPALLIVAMFWGFRFVGRFSLPDTWAKSLTSLGAVAAAVSFVIWWLFFYRAPRLDRAVDLLVLLLGSAVSLPLLHPSLKLVQTDGVALLIVPAVITAMVVWRLISGGATPRVRVIGMLALAVVAWGSLLVVRINDRGSWADVRWRWALTNEQRIFLERSARAKTGASAIGPIVVEPGDWPEFRGPNRDNRVTGLRINTDWIKHPPTCVWKQPIGSGWSNFSVAGGACFTQEQRGDDEATVCYRLDTGAEVWARSDAARFRDASSGPGPRATPTFHEGRIYAVGATGIFNCLDASTGQLIWQRNILKDAKATLQDWGVATSPLVVGDRVFVFGGGGEGKGTIAYGVADGEPVWMGGRGDHGFSSPQFAKLGGVELILMAHNLGLDALDPVKGHSAWQYDWNMDSNGRMLQPYVLGDNRVILASGYGNGTRLLEISRSGAAWQADDVWSTTKLTPYYNDFVVYQGHAYGFDGNIFCCLDVETGERKWKKGRYGFGQVLLLSDQGVLLLLAEDGNAVLLAASPDGLQEIAKQQVLEGKCGGFPVLVRGKLLVRNAEQAACYELSLESM